MQLTTRQSSSGELSPSAAQRRAQCVAVNLVVSLLIALSGLCAPAVFAAPAERPPILTNGLSHVGLTVRSLSKSTAFFTDVLGWKVAGGFPDYPATFVTDGQIVVTLWQATTPTKATAFDRKQNIGLHHLALSGKSFAALDELHKRMRRADDVTIEFGPQLNGAGPTKNMMVCEPSGNRIEFSHSPKPAPVKQPIVPAGSENIVSDFHYSPAVQAGQFIFASGVVAWLPIDADGKAEPATPENMRAAFTSAFEKITAVLNEAGAS